MNIIKSSVKVIVGLSLLLGACSSHSSELLDDISIYPLGFVRHFEIQPETNDGNLNYFALSKSFNKNKWFFETGFGAFTDTYHKEALLVFADISHKKHQNNLFRPVFNVHCAYKGHSYNKDNRKLQCYPLFKLRVGKAKGLFTNIIPIPKFSDVTNGLVALEVGYKF